MSISVRTPTYRRHKPTGKAVVTIDGRDHYLGKFLNDTDFEAASQALRGELVNAGAHDTVCIKTGRIFDTFVEVGAFLVTTPYQIKT